MMFPFKVSHYLQLHSIRPIVIGSKLFTNAPSIEGKKTSFHSNFFFLLGSSRWPKSHEGSLLQPRLIDGTGATPLLNRSGRSAWSGSESSLNSEDHPGGIGGGGTALSSNQSYRQSLSSCTLDPDSFTFASVTSSGATLTLHDIGKGV